MEKTNHYTLVAIGDESRRILLTVSALLTCSWVEYTRQDNRSITKRSLVCSARRQHSNLLSEDYEIGNKNLLSEDYEVGSREAKRR